MTPMNWLSERTDRQRGARASVVLGWVFVLLVLVPCCSLASGRPAAAHQGPAWAAAAPGPAWAAEGPRSASAVSASALAVRAVVTAAPDSRGQGNSCHGASEHSAPVVLPGQAAPAALPSAVAPLLSAPLTGGAVIRGPSNEAVADVDRLRIQVQRI